MTFYLFVIEVFLSILQWPVRVIFEQMLFPDVSLNGTDSQMVLSATSVSALVYHPLKKKTQHQFHVKNTGGSRQGGTKIFKAPRPRRGSCWEEQKEIVFPPRGFISIPS